MVGKRKKQKAPEGPRLDPRGYLLHGPANRACLLSSWVGESTGKGLELFYEEDCEGVEMEVKYYSTVNYGGVETHAGQQVLLEAEKKAFPASCAPSGACMRSTMKRLLSE